MNRPDDPLCQIARSFLCDRGVDRSRRPGSLCRAQCKSGDHGSGTLQLERRGFLGKFYFVTLDGSDLAFLDEMMLTVAAIFLGQLDAAPSSLSTVPTWVPSASTISICSRISIWRQLTPDDFLRFRDHPSRRCTSGVSARRTAGAAQEPTYGRSHCRMTKRI